MSKVSGKYLGTLKLFLNVFRHFTCRFLHVDCIHWHTNDPKGKEVNKTHKLLFFSKVHSLNRDRESWNCYMIMLLLGTDWTNK